MSGSKVNPRMGFKSGLQETGGYIRKNDKPRSANSPDWRGMFYLVGYGWVWVSGWNGNAKGAPMIRLSAQDMTDEQAERFCAPKERRTERAQNHGPQHHQNGHNQSQPTDTDIPF